MVRIKNLNEDMNPKAFQDLGPTIVSLRLNSRH